MDEALVIESLQQAGKRFILYGRDGSRKARFGFGDIVTLSSPGLCSWVDWRERRRYPPTTEELLQAVRVGDALEHIDIVGAMTQPVDVPEPIRDIYPTAELIKHTAKPAWVWVKNGATARYARGSSGVARSRLTTASTAVHRACRVRRWE